MAQKEKMYAALIYAAGEPFYLEVDAAQTFNLQHGAVATIRAKGFAVRYRVKRAPPNFLRAFRKVCPPIRDYRSLWRPPGQRGRQGHRQFNVDGAGRRRRQD
jgi:hypothetical protein